MAKNKSFTLIELLVVIAIVGLLTSIVLVSTRGATEKAKIAKTLQYSQSLYSYLGSDAVGIWNFDEGSGTTTRDFSGNGNNGTLLLAVLPPTWTTDTPHKVVGAGAGKYALSFNGSSNYVNCGSNASLDNIRGSQPYTLEAWIKPESLVIGWHGIIDKGSFGAQGFGIHTNINGNRINFGFHGNGNFDSNSILTPGQWYHIVGVHVAANDNYIFINGTEDIHCTSGCSLNVNNHDLFNLYIGRFENSLDFHGVIDEVRIYSRALTAMEIQKHYVEGLKKFQLAEK